MNSTDEWTRLSLLGGWQLTLNGNTSNGPAYQKGKALLAYLAVSKSPHSREALSAMLWPDSEGHLRRVLSNLRATLDAGSSVPSLLSDRHTLCLNPEYPLWVDAAAFSEPQPCPTDAAPSHRAACLDKMEYQVSLYNGDFMAGFSLPDCPEFEDWLLQERESLRSRMLMLLERLWQCYERTGNPAKALIHAQRQVALEPWNEAGQRHLIRLLALNGQPAAALSQFETCQRLLAKELGVLPEKETQALAERIRAGDLKPAKVGAAPPLPNAVNAAGEHRLLTMLACEFEVPGLENPEDLDDLAEALLVPQRQALEIIARYSGHIIQAQRHGILACFGFPLARENAARQAVRAALQIRDCLPAPVSVRIGVHSGMVISQGDQPDILGITAVFSAHLAGNTAPGSVAVSEVTERLISGYFRRHALGSLSPQGMAKALAVYCIEGESGAASRLESAASLTPLVGRQHELRQFQDFWQSARQGQAQTLLLRGEAGIGKSRLVQALQTQLAGASQILELRCFPEFEQSPLHPLLSLIETLSGFAPGDNESEKLAKLSAYLKERLPHAAGEALELLGPLWHLSASPSAPEPPQQQKQRTLSILTELLHRQGGDQPLLLILEDVHWCDPSTLEWLEVHAGRQAPMLTLLTARPEFKLEPDYARIMDLAPLSAAEITDLVRQLAQDLPAQAVLGIVARADGIPLYAEEMARVSQIQSDQREPLTLQELLTARLDGTGKAKPIARLAATLGREFDLTLLRHISSLTPDAFEQAINTLIYNGLIHSDHNETFAFRHALIQEAAYRSQPKKIRQAAHRRIAEALQATFPETAENQPEIVARHLTEAGETLNAVAYWLKAGHNAARHSAHLEARVHFETGLSLLKSLTDEETRNRLELQLQAALGGVLIALKGYGSEEAKRHFTRAAYLGRGAGDEAELFPIIYGLWLGGQSDSITVAPLDLAEKLMHIARRSGNPIHAIAAHYAHGNNLFWLARYREARQHLETVLSSFPEITSDRLIAELGEDTRVSCLSFLAWLEWFEGYPDRARRTIETATAQASAQGHAHTQGFALAFAATLYRHIGLPRETEAIGLELLKLAEHRELGLWTAVAYTAQGWARVLQGDAAALGQIEQGVAAVRVAMKLVDATISLYLADALVKSGCHQEALACLEGIIAQAIAWQDRYLLAEFFRLKAEALLALDGGGKEAEALLHNALQTAREQGSPMLELRAAIVLARLWRDKGDPERAYSMLNAVYSRFTEGFDTLDLQAAAALLGELATR